MTGSPKTILITGGTFGLGREAALGLAKAGHKVIAVGVNQRQVASTADGSVTSFRHELAEANLTIDVVEADVSEASEVRHLVAEAIRHHQRVDAVVNNAALAPLGTVLDTEERLFDRVLAVNLKGPFLTAKEIIPHFQQHGGGNIINIGSGSGWGKPNMAAYAASKGGLAALTSAIAYDFFHDHIQANLIIPGGGGIATGTTLSRQQFGGQLEQIGSVAGRPVNGYDISGVIHFLMSEAGATISGSVIDLGCFANQGGKVPQKGAK